MQQLFIMQVIRHDGQVIGTGWTGKKISIDALDDQTKLVKTLRRLKVLKGRGKVRLSSIDGEACLFQADAVQLVFRTN